MNFLATRCPFSSSVAHPGFQPGHPGYLWCPQSARHAWHPGRVGWYSGCGFGEGTEVRAILLTKFLTSKYIYIHTYIIYIKTHTVLLGSSEIIFLAQRQIPALTFLSLVLLFLSGDAAMQAAALASSLGFALVGGAFTGGWRRKLNHSRGTWQWNALRWLNGKGRVPVILRKGNSWVIKQFISSCKVS